MRYPLTEQMGYGLKPGLECRKDRRAKALVSMLQLTIKKEQKRPPSFFDLQWLIDVLRSWYGDQG